MSIDSLTIFIGNRNQIDLKEWESEQRDFLIKTQVYNPKLRFIKTKEGYYVQRISYLGAFDNWINIDKSDDLETLSLEYCYHLDKESFFELG